MSNLFHFKDLYETERLIRTHYDNSVSGIDYRSKIYDQVSGGNVEFGKVKNQKWEIYGSPGEYCIFVSVRDNGKTVYICFLVVKPELRNRGWGTSLLKMILERFATSTFRLTCVDELLDFYRKRGFRWLYKHGDLNHLEYKSPIPVYVDERNNPDQIIQKMVSEKLGRSVIQVSNWEEANFIWKPTSRGFTHQTYKLIAEKGGFVNHAPNSYRLTSKKNLYSFVPNYWLLPRFSGTIDNGGLWIVKPENGFGGNGIYITRTPEISPNTVIQKYLENPLLTSDGYKFDIRAFVLVTHNGVYVYRDCYVRRCSVPYNPDDISDLRGHLTNTCFQTSLPDVDPATLHEPGFPYMKHLQGILGEVSRKIGENCRLERGSFELFGLDILLDRDFKPWLLEINTNPSLEMQTPLTKVFIPRLLNSLFDNILLGKVDSESWIKNGY